MGAPQSLTELYNDMILPKDAELEKQAAELVKQAEEEDAAGRIMARGFADELNKLAGPNMGEGYNPFAGGRTAKAPSNASVNAGIGGGVKGPTGNARSASNTTQRGTGSTNSGAAAGGGRARGTMAAPAAPKPAVPKPAAAPKPAGGAAAGGGRPKIGPLNTASPLGDLTSRS